MTSATATRRKNAQTPAARKAPARGQAKLRALETLISPRLMSIEQLEAEARALEDAAQASARRWACGRPGCNGLPHRSWLHRHARASQRIPSGEWATWLIMAGRGWGKTRTGAETIRQWIEDAGDKPLQIAVVARKETLVREICFEHRKSGLNAILPKEWIRKYSKSIGDVHIELHNGTVIRGFGAQEPDNLRGWEFDKVWADEYAAWPRQLAQEVMDMLWFCLREADEPQVVITTTPKALPHIKTLVRQHEDELAAHADPDDEHAPEPSVRLTTGHTNDNAANLSKVALKRLDTSYGGTRQGQQELAGELLEDVEGALWQAWMLSTEGFRVAKRNLPELERLVISIDPAVTSTDNADETGFAVAGRSFPFPPEFADTRPRGYLLASETHRFTPTQAMRHAAKLYHQWQADCVVIEANNGGDYLPAVLEAVDPTVNWRVVHASRDKRARAAPVAGLYEQERISHVGSAKQYDALETTMTSYIGAPESQEKSPDDLDAVVWAFTDLFLDRETVPGDLSTDDRRLAGRR